MIISIVLRTGWHNAHYNFHMFIIDGYTEVQPLKYKNELNEDDYNLQTIKITPILG